VFGKEPWQDELMNKQFKDARLPTVTVEGQPEPPAFIIFLKTFSKIQFPENRWKPFFIGSGVLGVLNYLSRFTNRQRGRKQIHRQTERYSLQE